MENLSDQRTGRSRDLLYPFQLSSSSDADSRGVICGKVTEPISGERGTIVKIESKADYVR